MKRSISHVIAITAVAAGLSGAITVQAAESVPAAIAAAVADAGRPAADKERDVNRKPAEVVTFAGVKPGMTVAELQPGGGYFTRILAKAVGPKGVVFAVISPGIAQRPGQMDTWKKLTAEYPNVRVFVSDYTAVSLPYKVDVYWTTENYHDFHNGPTANIAALNKAAFDNLKSGGIFYVEDHSAADGAGLAATSKVHRMDIAVAKSELTAAGFKIDAEGTALRNPEDNRATMNSETGHFVTDRFMLRAKKP